MDSRCDRRCGFAFYYTRAVHQCIKTGEAAFDIGRHGFDGLIVAHVAPSDDEAFLCHAFEARERPRHDDDSKSIVAQTARHTASDTAGAAGDECYLMAI